MASKRAKPQETFPDLATFEREHARLLDQAAKDPDSLEGLHEREGNPRPLAPLVPETDEWVSTMIAGVQNNATKWKERTMRPKRDPIEAAKAAAGKYKQKLQEALNEGRWEKALDQVDEDAMVEAIERTDPGQFVAGVQKRERKIRGKVERLRPLLVAHKQAVEKLPVDTDAQREQKMIANLRGMRAIGKKMKGLG